MPANITFKLFRPFVRYLQTHGSKYTHV